MNRLCSHISFSCFCYGFVTLFLSYFPSLLFRTLLVYKFDEKNHWDPFQKNNAGKWSRCWWGVKNVYTTQMLRSFRSLSLPSIFASRCQQTKKLNEPSTKVGAKEWMKWILIFLQQAKLGKKFPYPTQFPFAFLFLLSEFVSYRIKIRMDKILFILWRK